MLRRGLPRHSSRPDTAGCSSAEPASVSPNIGNLTNRGLPVQDSFCLALPSKLPCPQTNHPCILPRSGLDTAKTGPSVPDRHRTEVPVLSYPRLTRLNSALASNRNVGGFTHVRLVQIGLSARTGFQYSLQKLHD